MASREALVQRRKRVEALVDMGRSVAKIAEMLDMSERTVRRDIAALRSFGNVADKRTVRRSTLPPHLVIEAYINYTVRFDVEPVSSNWNPTLAWKRGAAETLRYHEGWVSVTDGRHRAWPDPSRDTPPGGWSALRRAARAQMRQLKITGTLYEPPQVPYHARQKAFWQGLIRAPLEPGDPQVPDSVLWDSGDPELPGVGETQRGSVYKPLEECQGLAVVGRPKSGKTSLLYAQAMLDRRNHVSWAFSLPMGDVEFRREWLDRLTILAQVSPTPVALFADDAEDVLQEMVQLAMAVRVGVLSGLHLAVAWDFRNTPDDQALFLALRTREVMTQSDPIALRWLIENREQELTKRMVDLYRENMRWPADGDPGPATGEG